MQPKPALNPTQALMVDDLNSVYLVLHNLQITYAQQEGRLNQIKATVDPKDWAAAQAYIKWQNENMPQIGATHPATSQEQ